MLYSYITKNLIGLQDVILKNVEQDETFIYIYIQMPRKHQSAKRLTFYVIDKFSDERSFSSVARETSLSVSTVIRRFDMVGFIQPKTLPEVLAIDEFKGNTGKWAVWARILTQPDVSKWAKMAPNPILFFCLLFLWP